MVRSAAATCRVLDGPFEFPFLFSFLSFNFSNANGNTKSFNKKNAISSKQTIKLHIKKLELILRLLDNDELSPEQVNDVKDFLDDYVERNQVCVCLSPLL